MPPSQSQPEEATLLVRRALDQHEGNLIAYTAGILNGDVERAREVVQDALLKLYLTDPQKVRDSLKAWLFTVCRNRAFDVLRKDKNTQPLDDIRWKKIAGPGLQPDEQSVHDERLASVMKMLERLSDNQREVIILKFQQGLSYQEIQKITGLSSGNIGFLIHTGLKRLRDLMPDDLKS